MGGPGRKTTVMLGSGYFRDVRVGHSLASVGFLFAVALATPI